MLWILLAVTIFFGLTALFLGVHVLPVYHKYEATIVDDTCELTRTNDDTSWIIQVLIIALLIIGGGAGVGMGVPPSSMMSGSVQATSRRRKGMRLYGFLVAPRTVYVNSSFRIAIALKTESLGEVSAAKLSSDSISAGQALEIVVPQCSGEYDGLEVTLLGAELTVKGDESQQAAVTSGMLQFVWNCSFRSAEIHTVSLVVRHVRGKSKVTIGTFTHRIKAAQFMGLTARHAFVASSVLAVGGALSGMLTLLHTLEIWPFKPKAEVVSPLAPKTK